MPNAPLRRRVNDLGEILASPILKAKKTLQSRVLFVRPSSAANSNGVTLGVFEFRLYLNNLEKQSIKTKNWWEIGIEPRSIDGYIKTFSYMQ